MPIVVLVIGMAAALLVAAAPWSTPVPTVGGLAIGSFPGPVPSFAVPPAYHIVYRVTAPKIAPYTEDLWVERPYESVDETLSGAPPGGALDLATVTRLGEEILRAGNAEAALTYVPPAAAANDVRLDAVVGPALRQGYLVLAGRGRVDGRSCTVLRSAQSLRDSGSLPKLKPGGSYVDSCVDADGLVLSEATYAKDRLTELRRAVTVAVGARSASGGDYQMSGEPSDYNQGGGSFTALTLASSPPGTSWFASWLPPGFIHTGRDDVTPSQPEAFDQSSGSYSPNPLGLPGSLVIELDDTYVSGPNVIVVEQGVTVDGAAFKPPSGQPSVELGQLMGKGQLGVSASASVVSAEPGGHFVRVSGTVPPAELIRVARSLRLEAPGKLVDLKPGD